MRWFSKESHLGAGNLSSQNTANVQNPTIILIQSSMYNLSLWIEW